MDGVSKLLNSPVVWYKLKNKKTITLYSDQYRVMVFLTKLAFKVGHLHP